MSTQKAAPRQKVAPRERLHPANRTGRTYSSTIYVVAMITFAYRMEMQNPVKLYISYVNVSDRSHCVAIMYVMACSMTN